MQFEQLYLISESRFYNRTLHNKFWKNDKFDQNIRQKLLNIVKDILTAVDIQDIDDVQLTGSLANYNYTKFSDIDVHILLDFSKINTDVELVKAALDGKRFIWNLRHDIKMNDHEVELYFQDTTEPHIASGLFSLLNNEWITQPKYDPPEIDPNDVDKKAKTLLHDINKISSYINNNITTSDEAEIYYNKGRRLKEKIKKMRQAGLSREGEFSVENLSFKELRNNGAIGTLINAISQSYGKIYGENSLALDLFSKQGELANKVMRGNNLGNGEVKKRGKRTQKWGTGAQRLHQNMVPDMHKVDPTLNSKIETLRDRPGKIVISLTDLNYIIPTYKIKNISHDTRRDDPKYLGTTGIMLYFDTNNHAYCIEKL